MISETSLILSTVTCINTTRHVRLSLTPGGIEREHMVTILKRLEGFPRWTIIASSVVINLIVALADYVSSYELAFAIFYLAGVVLTSWLVGSRWGLVLATISMGLWLTTDILDDHVDSRP